MTSISMMIFIFLCFLGLFVMFFCLLRQQDSMLKALKQEILQNRAQLHSMEKRLAALTGEESDLYGLSSSGTMQGGALNGKMPLNASDGLQLYMEPPKQR